MHTELVMCNDCASLAPESSVRAVTAKRMNGIMRVKTLRDSLSSSYSRSSSTITSSTDLSEINSLQQVPPRSVQFGEIQIREYSITIGDNPSCSNGAPISLDWFHTKSDLLFQLENYEEYREPHRRQHAQLRMPKKVRLDILHNNWDFSLRSILAAEHETDLVRNKRQKTSIRARRAILREESMKSMKQSFKKLFSCRRKSKNTNSNQIDDAPPEIILVSE